MIRAKKKLGQNFLIDRDILEKIVNTVEIKNKEVLENLAVELVVGEMGIPEGDLQFDAKIEKPNIIHAHSAKGGVIARTASLFHKIKVLHTPQAYSYLSSPKGLKRIVFLGIEKALKNFSSILVASSTSELNRGLFEVGYKKRNTELFNNSINPITINSEDKISSQIPKKYICSVDL